MSYELISPAPKVYAHVYTWRCLCLQSRRGYGKFREQIARFLESDTPAAVTRRGGDSRSLRSDPAQSVKSADMTELRAPADRLAAALCDVDEEDYFAARCSKASCAERRSPWPRLIFSKRIVPLVSRTKVEG